jgi:hypothetical protein
VNTLLKKLARTSAIRKAKANMEKETAKNAKSNPKIFWKYANSKRKINTGISELKFKSEEGEERKTTTDKEKAEVLASFFSSVFTIEPVGVPLLRNQALAHRRIKYNCYRL